MRSGAIDQSKFKVLEVTSQYSDMLALLCFQMTWLVAFGSFEERVYIIFFYILCLCFRCCSPLGDLAFSGKRLCKFSNLSLNLVRLLARGVDQSTYHHKRTQKVADIYQGLE